MPTETFHNLDEEKKNKIILAAIEEFERHTLKGAKVVNIIKRVNISRASFYKYFDGIEELYFYLLGKIAKKWFDYLREELIINKGDIFMSVRNLFAKVSTDKSQNIEMIATLYDSNYIPPLLYVKGLGNLLADEIKELYKSTNIESFKSTKIHDVLEVYEAILSMFIMHIVEINLGFREFTTSIKSFDSKIKLLKNGVLK